MNLRNNTKYTTKSVKSTIESNNNLFSGYNGRIDQKLSEMDSYYTMGQRYKTTYENSLADLNSKKEQADGIFAQYGDSKFATPAITNPDDTKYAEQNECCKIVEEIIDIKSQLDTFYEQGTTNGDVAKCGFFGVNISPVIDVYKKLLSKGNELIKDGNSIIKKIQLLDDLTDDTITDQDLINDIDKYFQNCKEYNQIKNVERPATISSVKSQMNSAEAQFDHEGKTNISDILNRHPPCHCDEVNIRFYCDPKDYTDYGKAPGGTPTEYKSYKEKQFNKYDGSSSRTAPTGISIGENVTFIEWINFSETDSFNADTPVYGSWNIKPIVEVEIEGQDSQTLDIGTYSMFSEPQSAADNAVNALIDELNNKEDSGEEGNNSNKNEDEEKEYELESSPTDYCVTAKNYTLKYKVKRNNNATLTIEERTKNGAESYSNYTTLDTYTDKIGTSINSLLNDNLDYDYKYAYDSGEYIDKDKTYKLTRDSEKLGKELTENSVIKFTRTDLYKATYNDKDGNSVGNADEIEAYTAFDIGSNSPAGWPKTPIIEDGIMYVLCAEPYTYKIEGGPIDAVASNIEITPRYENTDINTDILSVTYSVKGCSGFSGWENSRIIEYRFTGETDKNGFITLTSSIETYKLDDKDSDGYGLISKNVREDIKNKENNLVDTWKPIVWPPFRNALLNSKINDLLNSTFIINTPSIKEYGSHIDCGIAGYLGLDLYTIIYGYRKDKTKEYSFNNYENDAIHLKEVRNEAWSNDGKRPISWPDGYEIGSIITEEDVEYIITKERSEFDNSGGGRYNYRYASELPYAHFVYGDSTPNKELKRKEICDPYQFDPRENGEFVPSSSPREFAGYTGYWTEANQAGNPYRAPIDNIDDSNFFSDVTFTYEYKGMPAVVYEYVIDPSVQPEDKSAINTAYNNDTSSDGGTITRDAWTPGYQYNKANFLTNFGESIIYEIKPDELPTEISDTYHAIITYYGYYEYWDEGEYVENSGVVHFWGAYNSETETYSESVEPDITGTLGESWTSRIRIVGGQASIVEVTEHEISDTRTKQLPGTSPMDLGGKSYNWWWEDKNGNHYTPGSSITIPVNDQPIKTASRVITIVGGQVIANAHTDGPVAELNLLKVLEK